MANLKQRLHKKNSNGTYDVIYLEADMSNVTGTLAIANGGTGATSAADARTNLSAASSSHTHGNVTNAGAITATGVTIANGDALVFADSSASGKLVKSSITFDGSTTTQALTKKGTWATFNNYTHPSTKQCNYSVDLTNYYTKNEVDAKLPGGTKPSSHTPGDVIWWDNKDWLVCHYDSSNNQVYLISVAILTKTIFGSSTAYSGSTIAALAASYGTGAMSSAALAQCVDVTVEGVTSKVFIPTYEQMIGGFSWFNTIANRIAYYQGNKTQYWTSSPYDSSFMWAVGGNGNLSYNGDSYPSSSCGFRPCVCVQL